MVKPIGWGKERKNVGHQSYEFTGNTFKAS